MKDDLRSEPESPAETADLGGFARAMLWVGLSALRIVLRIADVLALVGAPAILKAYFRLWRARWRDSPYRLDPGFEARLRRARAGVEDRQLSYGDTPVCVAMWALRRAGAGAGASVLDLGAGRGHVLLAARRLGAGARGVELERRHVDVAGPVLGAVDAQLEVGDATEAGLDGISHVFIAWTLFGPPARARIEAHLAGVVAGTKVLTLAHPLQSERFELRAKWTVIVPWGFEQVYLHEARAESPDQGTTT